MAKRTVRALALALALGALAAPSGAATLGGTFDVGITLTVPGGPPPSGGGGGTPPASSSTDICVSQSLSEATGAVVRVVCRSGHFVSIESQPGAPYLGVHGGAYRYYFANGIPASLRYLGGDDPWVGPGTITSIRVIYPEDLDGIIEMQVGF